MKKIKNLLILAIFLVSITVSYSQMSTNVIIFTVNKKGDKIFQSNEKNQKFVEFTISGLKTQEQVTELCQKFLNSVGVINFTISSEINNNQRKASATLFENAKFDYFKALLMSNGIDTLIIDGEEIRTENLENPKQNKSAGRKIIDK